MPGTDLPQVTFPRCELGETILAVGGDESFMTHPPTKEEADKAKRQILVSLVMALGMNQAHDYEGIHSDTEEILYLMAIHRAVNERRWRVIE